MRFGIEERFDHFLEIVGSGTPLAPPPPMNTESGAKTPESPRRAALGRGIEQVRRAHDENALALQLADHVVDKASCWSGIAFCASPIRRGARAARAARRPC
jgi:hypothetical protein